MNDDVVRQGHLGAHPALWVMRQHDLHLHAKHALAHGDVAHSLINVMPLGLTSGDQVAILELHGLGTLGAQLAANDDLASLCSVLHDEANHSIAGAAHCKATQQLVAQGLRLGHSTAGTVLHALSKQLNAVLWEAISLLHHGGELSDATALLTQDLTRSSCADNDLSPDGCDAHLYASIAILGQSAHQELVQLRIEYTVSHKLALLGNLDLGRHGSNYSPSMLHYLYWDSLALPHPT
mmetsp:Transcript_43504/g.102517  ORF Transcript_43504/g.102517 Transcript_43504/m.102517 type:complete len:237 (+) Transcript_43504:158-868(+)